MKRFTGHILLFSIFVIVFFAVTETYVEHLPNPSRYKHKWMLQHSRDIHTLVLGNSHAFYGLRSDSLGKHAFSLAQVSQTYRYDNYLLTHYDMPSLRRVVIPFSYMSLWEDFESQDDKRFNAVRYRLYMDCDIHSRLSRYGLECLHIPSFKTKLKSLYQPPQLTWDSLGWGNHYKGHRFKDWDNGVERIAENTCHDTSLVRLNLRFLEDMLNWCQHRHVQVLLVITPVSPVYFKHEDSFQRQVNRKCLADIQHRHPEITCMDYEQDGRFAPDDFYDADHLNDKGAGKLSSFIRSGFLPLP